MAKYCAAQIKMKNWLRRLLRYIVLGISWALTIILMIPCGVFLFIVFVIWSMLDWCLAWLENRIGITKILYHAVFGLGLFLLGVFILPAGICIVLIITVWSACAWCIDHLEVRNPAEFYYSFISKDD